MARDPSPGAPARIHFVSLGCPKNRVDSEVMLGVAEREGYAHAAAPEDAEVIVINTCGFIEPAKQESIETILELAQLKQDGNCKKLVVAGCLSQRHGPEMAEEMPEVDHFLGSSDMLRLGQVLRDAAPRIHIGNPADWVIGASDPRRISTRGASAYVKIAEGCNRNCSFCVIPQLRGKQRSRARGDVVDEVKALAASGVLEVNLISQDTVSYGRDREGKPELPELVWQIADVPGIEWVRLFYLYPEKLSDGIVELIAEHPKVLPYIDMPLQHAADAMLRRMRRGHGGDRLRSFVETVRTKLPDVVFRTAFIVGHPGESDGEFDELCDFVRWAEFDHVGVFHYSDEPTSHSFELGDKVDESVARERAAQLMDIQREISTRKNEARIGSEVDVLVEGPSEESELVMQGRWHGQAPDIDGHVYVSGGPVYPGRMYRGVVEQATDYDLMVDVGELDDPSDAGATTRFASVGEGSGLVHRQSDGRITLRTV